MTHKYKVSVPGEPKMNKMLTFLTAWYMIFSPVRVLTNFAYIITGLDGSNFHDSLRKGYTMMLDSVQIFLVVHIVSTSFQQLAQKYASFEAR